MDKKDFKNACMVAGGTAIAAASGVAMHTSSVSVPTELLSDLAQIGAVVAPLAGVGGLGLIALGLTPLAIKYSKKLYDKLKGKSIEHSQTKTQQKSNVHGHLKEDLAKGFNRGADINLAQQSKPVQKTVPNKKVVQQQSQR